MLELFYGCVNSFYRYSGQIKGVRVEKNGNDDRIMLKKYDLAIAIG